MIRTVTLGVARLLFNAAMLTLLLALVLVYASFRLVRSSVAKDRGQPVRDAGVGVLLAVVALVKAAQSQREKTS